MPDKAVNVIYPGPSDEVVTADGISFKRGRPVSVPAGLAVALIRQGFEEEK